MTFTVYILFSATLNRYYIGFTGDELGQRIKKHLSNHRGYTGRAKDWEVVYSEIYQSKDEAFVRERQMKGWKSRRLIESFNRLLLSVFDK